MTQLGCEEFPGCVGVMWYLMYSPGQEVDTACIIVGDVHLSPACV